MTTNDPAQPPGEDPIRHHVYDGIAEYDRRLPNWWLMTFYGAIVYSIIYWAVTQHLSRATDVTHLQVELSKIDAAKFANGAAVAEDGTLWTMSRNALVVDAGRTTFQSTCASCHGEKLAGGIGPNLADESWLHGGKPTEVLYTVNAGILAKGMPAWGPVLGAKKISELTAYILSFHTAPGTP